MEYVKIKDDKINVDTARPCCKIRGKIQTIIVNQQYYLKKNDVVGFLCPHCGKIEEQKFRFKTKFLNSPLCNKCNKSLNNPYKKEEVKEKIRIKKLKKYNNGAYTNRSKAKKTMFEKYGVEHALQDEETKEKLKSTNIEKYGSSYPLQNKSIYNKMLETKKHKYNNGLYNNREKYLETMQNVRVETSKRIKLTKLKKSFDDIGKIKTVRPLFSIDEYKNKTHKYDIFLWKCEKCHTEFQDYFANGRIPRCPKCYPVLSGTSKLENEIFNWIKSLKIKNIKPNDRKVLKGPELDIYLPDYNLAIEFDGLYWHSELNNKDKNYHLDKTLECEKQGIELIHIFEDGWIEKQEIIKSIIKGKLGLNNKIYARKCELRELPSSECKDFLNNNHLQGYIPSKVNIGLYYEGELVSLITLGMSRYNKQYDWEILRFVNKLGYSVIGGFAKMLKHFTSKYSGSIITYSDRRYFDGRVYESNGFTKLKPSAPNYYYTNYKHRFSRVQFQKHKLEEKLQHFDSNLTEWENMQMNGWDRIWDCGNNVFIKKASSSELA